MSEFLDQSEIDRLQFALSEVTAKKRKVIQCYSKDKTNVFYCCKTIL